MKNKLFLCSLLFVSCAVLAQGSSTDYTIASSTKNDNTLAGMWIPGKAMDKKIEGSVYLFPNSRGLFKVTTIEGDTHQLFNLNYNIKSQRLESMVSKDSVFLYDLNTIDFIINNNTKYKAIFEGELNGLFLEVFSNDKIKLYKKSHIVVEEGVMNPLTQEMISENKYIQKFSYFFWIKDEYVETKLTKGNVLKLLSDKKDLIKEYASKNKLSYSSEEDIKNILNHYSTI